MTTNSTPTEEAREIATRWAGENGIAFGANQGKFLVEAISSALKASELAGYNRGVEDGEKAAHDKAFDQGYVCAVANIINTHDEEVIAWDVLRANMPKDWSIINEVDIQSLMKMFKFRASIKQFKGLAEIRKLNKAG